MSCHAYITILLFIAQVIAKERLILEAVTSQSTRLKHKDRELERSHALQRVLVAQKVRERLTLARSLHAWHCDVLVKREAARAEWARQQLEQTRREHQEERRTAQDKRVPRERAAAKINAHLLHTKTGKCRYLQAKA